MAKKFKAIVRLQLEAGKANPAPPVGPALAGHGINIMAFCKEYNARTSNRQGEVLPAEITVYTDGSFTFVLKTSPAAVLLRKGGSRWYCVALALILGGALGNLYDRVMLGHVIDFLLFHWRGWSYPAFNVADSAITVGAAMLILDSFRRRPADVSAAAAKGR